MDHDPERCPVVSRRNSFCAWRPERKIPRQRSGWVRHLRRDLLPDWKHLPATEALAGALRSYRWRPIKILQPKRPIAGHPPYPEKRASEGIRISYVALPLLEAYCHSQNELLGRKT